jgi:predicted secreted protein
MLSHARRVLSSAPGPSGLVSPLLRAAAACIVALLGTLGSQTSVAQAAEPQNLMSLSATASAEVTLDMLSVTLSTTREGSDAAAVQAQLKQALDAALIEARKVARPGALEIRTGNFSLVPRYAPKGGISGWQGTAQLQIEGRDLTAISQLAGRIQTLTVAGVSQGLSREAREKVETETTALAIARFRERALEQSRLFGFAGYAVREVQVSSDGGGQPPPVFSARMQAMKVASDEAVPVQVGKTTVSSSVSGSVQMLK